MKKTDIGVIAFMYGICIWFAIMNAGLPKDAQIYPRFIIIVLASLTTLYFVKNLILAKKDGVSSGFSELFKGFLPKQFFPILGTALGYLVALFFIGFYLATVIFMVCVLLKLKIKPLTVCITTAAILALVFVTFNLVLKVSLIRGLLFDALL